MRRLEGRVALVTGAASGIGREAAHRLAAEGATVVVSDVQDDAGEAAAAAISGDGCSAVFLHQDVTDEAGWDAAVAQVLEEHGRLDILVNNAGMGDLASIEETSLEDYERMVAVNQTGVFLGMKACAQALKASDHGCVINISSIFGTSGGFGRSPAYHAAKGAVRTLTKNVALHWAMEGVRVNSIHPGFIRTPILDQGAGSDIREALMTASTPMGRLGEPAEVAAAIAFLASDDASFVTGSELYVDGGFLAR